MHTHLPAVAETDAVPVPAVRPDREQELGQLLAVGWAALDSVFEPGGPLSRFVFDPAAFEAALGSDGADASGWRASDAVRDRVMRRLYTGAYRRVLVLAIREAGGRPHRELAHRLGLRIAEEALAAGYAAVDCPVGRAIFEAAWVARRARAG